MPASPRRWTCTGTLYPGEMDRYAGGGVRIPV
jgi:hypothetical protein